MSAKDHLSNRVGARLRLSEKGVSAEVKSRTVAALDRLLGSLIDIPTAKLEAMAARNRVQDIRGAQRIETDQELPGVGVAVARHDLEKAARRASNKRHVADRTLEHLAGEPSGEESQTGELSLDEDWLNYFEDYAEKASTEKLRDIWARVLAGEIRRPKSFSLATLRFMSELDKSIASAFEAAVQRRSSEGFILKPDKSEMRGDRLLELVFLEEVGLLQDVNGTLQITTKPDGEGTWHWREGGCALVGKTKAEVKVPVIMITRTGREVAQILPPANAIELLEDIGAKIHSQVDSMELCAVVSENSEGFRTHTIKVLKRPSSEK